MKRFAAHTALILAFVMAFAAPAFAAPDMDAPNTETPEPALPDAASPAVAEARAQLLDAEIRCVTCQSESIADSQADMARDLRRLVRAKIDLGWSDTQILAYLRSRYGDFVLLNPPLKASTTPLWLCPLLFLALAALAGFGFYRRASRRDGASRSKK